MDDDLLEVIGGAGKGGIIVRVGKHLASTQQSQRLASGARVRVVERDVELGRVRYELLTGSGPPSGWVSISAHGKDLMTKVPEAHHVWQYRRQLAESRAAYVQGGRRSRRAAQVAPNVAGSAKVQEQATVATWQPRLPQTAPRYDARRPAIRRQVQPGIVALCRVEQRRGNDTTQDSDGEELFLCPMCRLPLGDWAYTSEGEEGVYLHAECKAEALANAALKERRACKEKQAALKQARHVEYNIGWKAEQIPSNMAVAGNLSRCPLATGMIGLVLSEDYQSLGIASTADPAACVNLEYMLVALRVRLREGREPFFSLDPKEGPSVANRENALWQLKRFSPAWLASTSVGEVMFQADYYLKALSMGEYPQPIIGLKSCFDYLEEQVQTEEWNARQWFVVKKAAILLSPDNFLVPGVTMGVEAREQVHGLEGMEDARITRPGHPLLKYAEGFSHYFDLIAERRSVIYHLRALAKCAVLAKFLVEFNVRVDEQWLSFDAEGKVVSPTEVPQLWNERSYSRVHVSDGKILDANEGIPSLMRGLYGGVQFGLDQLRLRAPALPPPATVPVSAAPPAATVAVAAPRAPVRAVGAVFPVPQLRTVALVSEVPKGPVLRPFAPIVGPQRLAMAGGAARGVDLSLDAFNLSAPVRTTSHRQLDVYGAAAKPSIAGSKFWDSLASQSDSTYSGAEKALLEKVFAGTFCDRREEGALFVPPERNDAYQCKLGELLEEEEACRRQRKASFFSADFCANDPGSLFPSSWTPQFRIEGHDVVHRRCLHPHPDFREDVPRLEKALEILSPVFDNVTEDGVRFCIYHMGSLEVRTARELNGKELIGAVFSSTSYPKFLPAEGESLQEVRVAKVTRYVERAHLGSSALGERRPLAAQSHYYIVFESDCGEAILTEKRRDGTVVWERNSSSLDARNAAAKVVSSSTCSDSSLRLRDLNCDDEHERSPPGSAASPSTCKRYATEVYRRALSIGSTAQDSGAEAAGSEDSQVRASSPRRSEHRDEQEKQEQASNVGYEP